MKTKVFLTVDTEVYPLTPDWRQRGLVDDANRDLYGMVGGDELGLRYQLKTLSQFGLKADFFIEPLFASSKHVEPRILADLVAEIQQAGQGIQLHLHPEWVPELASEIPDRGHLLKDYTEHEQQELIATALANLRKAGATRVVAFRAGDYAADARTLRCLARSGLRIDTSYNFPYLGKTCALDSLGTLCQPAQLEGVWEFPVTFFTDYKHHFRHAQLRACSVRELIHCLESAHDRGWGAVVIVLHTFEMLANRWTNRPIRVAAHVVRRFIRLCRFLSENRHRFATVSFSDVDERDIRTFLGAQPIVGKLHWTASRIVEQVLARALQRLPSSIGPPATTRSGALR
jgi:hypothetical protein